jgi:cytochrome c-type biogenesis protein CcmF
LRAASARGRGRRTLRYRAGVGDLGRALLVAGFVSALASVARGSLAVAWATASLLAGAAGALAWALVTSDFSLAYVAETSRRGASIWYRFAALWGGSAGSLLFLATVVAVVGAVAGRTSSSRGERRVLAVPAAALAGLTLFAADPFTAATVAPIDGVGLTPILEHPAMAIHPPLLYLGLAATIPPYAAAVAGARSADAAERCRRWLLLVVGASTIAMALGGLWSYVEAGWGGYWAWDPVENTSLAVWLAALVVLHAHIAGRALPAAIPAVLAAAGTALTRSGVASSVHAFAEDTTLGWGLAALAVAALLGPIVARHGTGLPARRPPDPDARTNRLTGTALTSAVLAAAALAVVVIGTATPAVRRLAGDPGTGVGGWFYARIVGPLAFVALVVLTATAPVARRTRVIAGAAGVAGAAGALAADWPLAGAGLAAAGVAAMVVCGAAAFDRAGPMWVAHLGIALLLVGVAGTTATQARTLGLAEDGGDRVGPVAVANEGVSVREGDGTSAVVVGLRFADGGVTRELDAALVAYPAWDGVLAETALWSRPWRDVQATLVRADDTGRAVVEIRVRPFAQLLWWGAVVTAAGVALSARRRPVVPAEEAPAVGRAGVTVDSL